MLSSLSFFGAVVAAAGLEQGSRTGVEAHPVRRPRARASKSRAGGERGRGHGQTAVEHARSR